MKKSKQRILAWALLLAASAALLAGCGSSHAQQLTADVRGQAVSGEYTREASLATADFGFQLLRRVRQGSGEGENLLISPLSAAYALGMATSGARGDTLAQLEQVLGLPEDQLGQALGAYLGQIDGDKQLRLANSLWINETSGFEAERSFLEGAAGRYQAQVYRGPFDDKTLKQVNRWVEQQTDGMIPEILDNFSWDAVMMLVNALCFDAEWAEKYQSRQVREGQFTTEDGQARRVQMMYSTENRYLELEGGQGFLKPYQGGRYALLALLPEEGTSLEQFLSGLTGEKLVQALEHSIDADVYAAIPQFESQAGYELQGFLQEMGVEDAFDPGKADFSAMGKSKTGILYFNRVLQRTFIHVDADGTRAGAATAVEIGDGAAPSLQKPEYTVHLDRPFLYLLWDRQAGAPLMLGAMQDPEGE